MLAVDEEFPLRYRYLEFELFDLGRLLRDSPDVLAGMERLAESMPDDDPGAATLRAVLMCASLTGDRDLLAEHVFWFLQNRPTAPVVPFGQLFRDVDDRFEEAERTWQGLLAAEMSPELAYNAVVWFGHAVPDWLQELIRSDQALPAHLRLFLLAEAIRFDDPNTARSLYQEAEASATDTANRQHLRLSVELLERIDVPDPATDLT